MDRELVKTKYNEILKCFKTELPDEPPSAAVQERINCGLAKDYPHFKEEVMNK